MLELQPENHLSVGLTSNVFVRLILSPGRTNKETKKNSRATRAASAIKYNPMSPDLWSMY